MYLIQINGRVLCCNTIHALTKPTETAAGRLVFIIPTPEPYAPWWDSIGAFRVLARECGKPPREDIMAQLALQFIDSPSVSVKTRVVESLALLRKDWEVAAEGESLLNIEGSVGLILFDIVTRLELNVDEQRVLLGNALFEEIKNFIAFQPSV